MAAVAATKAAIMRAIGAAKELGFDVRGYTIAKDGTISVTIADPPDPKTKIDRAAGAVAPLQPRQWRQG